MSKAATQSSTPALAIAVVWGCVGVPLVAAAALSASPFLAFAVVCWLWWGLVPWALLFTFMAARGRITLGVWVSLPFVGVLALCYRVLAS